MSISKTHCDGLRDLLFNERNTPVLLQLAKSVTRNICSIEDPEEALGYLTTQVLDIHLLLHKRHITRDLLFKYLQTRLPGTLTDFTKADLVMKVIQYWDEKPSTRTQAQEAPIVSVATEKNHQKLQVNLIARQFSEWFFDKLNANNLILSDFWSDATLQLKVIADDGDNQLACNGATEVLNSLVRVKQQFGFHFNANLSQSGAQGRIDNYGQVIVLSCGTLHTAERCVGVFECAFGLLRDPYLGNNWKPQKFKCLLRSKLCPPNLHTLEDSETLKAALALPAANDYRSHETL